MKRGHLNRSQAWLKRRTLRSEDMRGWDADDWEHWWADGLEIWFSHYPLADREQAFAPFRIDGERERPNERLPALLDRFYDSARSPSALAAIQLQEAIEEGAIRVSSVRRILCNVARAALLVRVLSLVRAHRTEDLVSSVVAAAAKGWFGEEPLDELLSALSLAVVEMTAVDRLSETTRDHFESILRGQPNFRPILMYAIRRFPHDAANCLATLGYLWRGHHSLRADATWRAIADDLNKHFGRSKIASVLHHTRPSSLFSRVGNTAWAYLPIECLKPFYPEVLKSGSTKGPIIAKGLRGLIKEAGLPSTFDSDRNLTTVYEDDRLYQPT